MHKCFILQKLHNILFDVIHNNLKEHHTEKLYNGSTTA